MDPYDYYKDAERGWIAHERYERMKNDENYRIKTLIRCDHCQESFFGPPESRRESNSEFFNFCSQSCLLGWKRYKKDAL